MQHTCEGFRRNAHPRVISKHRGGVSAERAGMQVFPTHILLYTGRHTFGTAMVQGTRNVFAVSEAMGHQDIKSIRPSSTTTQRSWGMQ